MLAVNVPFAAQQQSGEPHNQHFEAQATGVCFVLFSALTYLLLGIYSVHTLLRLRDSNSGT